MATSAVSPCSFFPPLDGDPQADSAINAIALTRSARFLRMTMPLCPGGPGPVPGREGSLSGGREEDVRFPVATGH
ncbi:hypothetical protein Van01_27400 [Micromonospora andamanensis]|uniref:Uncharacterized protein n=1 Tax=Micromonospora andamanensis TaxID=1287068 RepID=A0ABQ4HV61_9ACTN|nr:hypothetical protein Van01_27400 [Micromonospora andamanensis]